MADSLLIGMSGLTAQQRAMQVTSQNLANATTEGYTRQQLSLQTAAPMSAGVGQVGNGVDINAVRRIADGMIDDRLRQAEGEAGRLSTLKNNLDVVQQAFNEPGSNGLSAIIGTVFGALQDLSNNPESVAVRATTVEQLTTFTNTVSDLGTRIANLRSDLDSGLQAELGSINDLTSGIATLNRQIRSQVNLGGAPNDLLDQRSRLLSQLTGKLDCQVRIDAKDLTATVAVRGRLLVGRDSADAMTMATTPEGKASIVGSSGFSYEVSGGSVGAMMDLHDNQLPTLSAQLDTMTSTVAKAMNQIHATGTSNAHTMNTAVGETSISVNGLDTDLDSATLVPVASGQPGIPKAFLPSFTDANGTQVPRDLTINVLDGTTKVASKFTLRWDPAQNNGGRSLQDLATAINTGVGGGWSVYPPGSLGVTGVNAQAVLADGSYHLQLTTTDPTDSMDFSKALDLKPSASAWTGPAVQVSGAWSYTPSGGTPMAAPPRVQLTVDAGGTTVSAAVRDPTTGNLIPLQDGTGSVAHIPIPAVGNTTVAVAGLSITVPAGTYRAGDTLGLSLAADGSVIGTSSNGVADGLWDSSHAGLPAWNAADAPVSISGRYTNSLSDPSHPWSVKILASGTVGAKAGAVPGPPTVQFTYWTGTPAAPVQQVITKTLDSSLPAGTPIALADGVYASIGAGTLSTVGNRLDFTVDGDPDQAGLLPALGINNLFSGGDRATTIAVDARIAADPSQLDVASSRAEGDNSNVVNLIAVRSAKLFANGSFTAEDFYTGVISDVGVRIQQADRLSQNQDALKASLSRQREQLSGVSIDEEVGRLIQQQQAYSAAAKVVSAARDNMQTLLEILR